MEILGDDGEPASSYYNLRIIAGADPFGAALKSVLVDYARQKGIEVVDLETDAYYRVAGEVAKRVHAANAAPFTEAVEDPSEDVRNLEQPEVSETLESLQPPEAPETSENSHPLENGETSEEARQHNIPETLEKSQQPEALEASQHPENAETIESSENPAVPTTFKGPEDSQTPETLEKLGSNIEAEEKDEKVFEACGLVCCGTGVGVSMVANKFPGIFAVLCDDKEAAMNARSIYNANVLALGGRQTTAETGKEILDAWLETSFQDACPASGNKPWNNQIRSMLEESAKNLNNIVTAPHYELPGLSIDATQNGEGEDEDPVVCDLSAGREFEKMLRLPGCKWKLLHKSPTSALVRFKAGSLEPLHHHTFGHDVYIVRGRCKVFNVTKDSAVELGRGDYLYTPAGDKHRVLYLSDCEFFISWDGKADVLLDEKLSAAKAALMSENVPNANCSLL